MFLPFVGCCTCGADRLYELGLEHENGLEDTYPRKWGEGLNYWQKESNTQAAIYFKKAADKGHLEAQYRLAKALLEKNALTEEGYAYIVPHEPKARYTYPYAPPQLGTPTEIYAKSLMNKAALKGHVKAKAALEELNTRLKAEKERSDTIREKEAEEKRKIDQWAAARQAELKEEKRLANFEREREQYRLEKYEREHPEIGLLKEQNRLLKQIEENSRRY